MNNKTIKELELEVEDKLSTKDGVDDFRRALVEHCYGTLDDEQKKLYHSMIEAFDDITEGEASSGLSIIFMDYPFYAGGEENLYEFIMNEHSKLIGEWWTPNRVEQWVIMELTKGIEPTQN